jgi:hypothetical protein
VGALVAVGAGLVAVGGTAVGWGAVVGAVVGAGVGAVPHAILAVRMMVIVNATIMIFFIYCPQI